MVENRSLFPIPSNPVLEDRPISSEAEDRLDRSGFTAGLIRALVVDERDANDRLVARRATNYGSENCPGTVRQCSVAVRFVGCPMSRRSLS